MTGRNRDERGPDALIAWLAVMGFVLIVLHLEGIV